MLNISVGVWSFGMGTDRYVSEGYKGYKTFIERVNEIGKIDGIDGIEITYPCDINEDNWEEIKPILEKNNLKLVGMGVEVVCDKQWKDGSLSAIDETRRQKSIELVKKAIDFAQLTGVKTVSLWLGQDGFDYIFQNDYVTAYNNMVKSLTECAKHNPEINLGLEYKISEPRMHCMVSNAGMALSIAQATGMANVGVTMDVGHSFNTGENPAEIAAILLSQNRLFHLHINDNYRIADDDMPVGTVHWPQYFELLFWLKKLGYNGWYSLDMYPYRDCPTAACEASVTFMRGAKKFVDELDPNEYATGKDTKPSDIINRMCKKFFSL